MNGLNQNSDEQIRRALYLWGSSDQIERYRPGIVSKELKAILTWALYGFFIGFTLGALVIGAMK